MFSSRLPATLETNRLSTVLAQLRSSGTVLFDLTETNPTAVGLPYPEDLLRALDDDRALSYRPDPRGDRTAREAVAATYRARGVDVSADRIVLTASTSEAYAFLFKLLCNPGDSIHIPQPSYPLFDLLAGLEGVAAVPYALNPFDAWTVERDGLFRGLTSRSRAVLVVSPNNPTGSMVRAADREWIVEVASGRGLAVISDEVFADYPLAPLPDASSLAGEARVLTFTLGGLSKSAALPQMKLAWIIVSGPGHLVEPALDRLDLIADTYLSVSTPVQVAAPALLRGGAVVQRSVHARVRANLMQLRSAIALVPSLTLMEPEGGWSAVIRIPATMSEEQIVLRLLEQAQVVTHPGYFFDFRQEAFLVVSLLPELGVFREGASRLVAFLSGAAVS